MSGAASRGARLRPRSQLRRTTREILSRLARVLAMGGEDPQALAREFKRVCERLRVRPVAKEDAAESLKHGQVIARWYNEPEYVDRAGNPRALPFSGSRHSLSGLIAEVLPEADPHAVLEDLKELGAVRTRGRLFLPTDDLLIFGHRREHLIPWLLTLLSGTLRTIEHNATCHPRDRIPDRIAHNPNFPVVALSEFYARLRNGSTRFLREKDRDMQRQEMRGGNSPRIGLRVAVIAFEEPAASGRATKKTKRRTRTPREGRRRSGDR